MPNPLSEWRITPAVGDYWEAWDLWHYDNSFGKWMIHSRYMRKMDALNMMKEMAAAA